jgi:hypothetical protein
LKSQDSVSEARDSFERACNQFLASIEEFNARGSDAFITNNLEALLLSFTTFMRRSLNSERPITGAVLMGTSVGVGKNVAATLAVATSALSVAGSTVGLIALGAAAVGLRAS